MGIPRYLSHIFWKFKTVIKEQYQTDVILIDGNCIYHIALDRLSHKLKPSIEDLKGEIKKTYEQYLGLFKFERCIICLDGMASSSKKMCQRERREKNSNVLSIEMIPGTNLSATINTFLKETFTDAKYFIDDTSNPGEGEHKIIDYIVTQNIKSSIIVTSDSDLIILSLLRTQGTFVFYLSKNLSVDIDQLRTIFESKGLFNSLFEIVVACGNDYLPKCIERLTIEDIEKIFAFKKKSKEFDITIFLESLRIYDTKRKCNCDKELIRSYFYQLKWFVTCYSSNIFLTGTEFFKGLNAPCINCMISQKHVYEELVFVDNEIQQSEQDYAEDILPSELKKYKELFKND
jgi:predicted nuclease of predicted toxin-antitoxin system